MVILYLNSLSYSSFQSKILETLPEVLTKLKFRPFEISEIEVQLTAHNDGCYYKIHNDAGSEKTASREITYVYYFYQEPKAFSGGGTENL